ncbi:phosphotransferase [Crossiella sp. CA-258035]|uniref:phosphotransferase n=1 Tax=Crossiella sp. CA-258035 TaxID=2981138 RepID=UPI0032DA78E4
MPALAEFLTPERIARRTAAAVDAAVAAGRERGLTVTGARVLHEVFSVVVHLAPAPVVARMPVVLPESATVHTLAQRQQAELDVTWWLDQQGVPVIPPSPLVAREPVARDGFSMTFWQFVEEDRSGEPDYAVNAESTARLHAALRDYPGPLSYLSAAEPDFITECLTLLEQGPSPISAADVARARREWAALEPLVRSRAAFEERFPGIDVQPIHGDSPPANIFAGVDGPRYADFELVTLGPVEWDLAALGPELEAAYNRGARREGLRELDAEVSRFVNGVGVLRAIAFLALAPQLPALVDYVLPSLEEWRAG